MQCLLEGWLALGSGLADLHVRLQARFKPTHFIGLQPGKLQGAKVVHRHLAWPFSWHCIGASL